MSNAHMSVRISSRKYRLPKADKLTTSLFRIESHLAVYEAWRNGKDYKAVADVCGVTECATSRSKPQTGAECLSAIMGDMGAWRIGSPTFDLCLEPIVMVSGMLLTLELIKIGASKSDKGSAYDQLRAQLQKRRSYEIEENATEAWLMREALKDLSDSLSRATSFAIRGGAIRNSK